MEAPGSRSARSFFEAIAGRYERAYALPSDESRARMRRVLRALPPSAHVLDLGVGPGRELSALLDAGHSPVGIDVSPRMLERCAHRARPVPLVQADFWERLPFDDACFDAAVALHGTLAHPPADDALATLAREVGRVVRADGAWVIEVPAPAWLDAPAREEQRITRLGPTSAIVEDAPTGATIEVRLRSAAEWVEALRPVWQARVETISAVEWLVVARRAS